MKYKNIVLLIVIGLTAGLLQSCQQNNDVTSDKLLEYKSQNLDVKKTRELNEDVLNEASEIWLILLFGQSLSTGSNSGPVVNPEPYSDLMLGFTEGPVTRETEDLSSISLLREQLLNPAQYVYIGETGLHGMGRQLVDGGMSQPCIFASIGQGGKSISYFDDEATTQEWFDKVYVRHLTAAKEFADKRNLPLVVKALVWHQGEANNGAGGSIGTYKPKLDLILNQTRNKAVEISGQAVPPVFLSYQTSWNTLQTDTTVSGAKPAGATKSQLELAQDGVLQMTSPVYPFLHNELDNIHLRSQGYDDLGQVTGHALKRILLYGLMGGGQLLPGQPSLSQDGTRITLPFTGGFIGPLVIDTVNLPPTKNNGFYVEDSQGAAGIKSIKAYNTTVEITLNRALSSTDRKLSYAYQYRAEGLKGGGITQASGNLRDSTVVDLNRPSLRRWSPHFEVTF